MSEPISLKRVAIRRFTGDESIGNSEKTVLDFWQWSSDLFENVQRGIFAEYLVAASLDVTEPARIGWAGYDLLYGEHKVEVKSSSYLQSWKQRSLSRPIFGIGERGQWDEETGLFSDPVYVADVFVFCLFAEREPDRADILDLRQWKFYVVHTDTIKNGFPESRSISIERLSALTGSVDVRELRQRVDNVLKHPSAFVFAGVPRREDGDIEEARYTYAVSERGTRFSPVIVYAKDYREAFQLARSDETIRTYGNNISAVRLSKSALDELIKGGARDLRTCEGHGPSVGAVDG